MMKKVLMFLVVLLCTSIGVRAAEVLTLDGNGADTYLSNDDQRPNFSADTTHGGEEVCKLRNLEGVRLKIPYIRFDISSFKSPGTEVDSAKIALWPTAYKGQAFPELSVYALVNEDLDNWDEMTTCFNNAPGFIPYPAVALGSYEMTADLVLVDVMIVDIDLVAPGSDWRDGIAYFHSNGSDALDDFINSDTNGLLTFAFIGDPIVDHDFDIASKEDPELRPPKLIFNTVTTGVDDGNKATVNEFTLNQNYPNPFNPKTTISYQLIKNSEVYLAVYNQAGQKVRTLVQEKQGPGYQCVSWDGRDDAGQSLSSGIYLYRLQVDNKVQTRKLMLMK